MRLQENLATIISRTQRGNGKTTRLLDFLDIMLSEKISKNNEGKILLICYKQSLWKNLLSDYFTPNVWRSHIITIDVNEIKNRFPGIKGYTIYDIVIEPEALLKL